MSIYKYNSIRYNGGVDISNTLSFPENTPAKAVRQDAEKDGGQTETAAAEIRQSHEKIIADAEDKLRRRQEELDEAAADIERRKRELAELKEQYIEQGKQVIVEAKRRAEGILNGANSDADAIVRDAEGRRDDVLIKARAEGFEQGKKDGRELVLTESRSILDTAREYSERINIEKAELFAKYEKEIFDTVMEIANKVTMNSMSVKDGTAAKKLIKAAAKEFRNSQLIRITLDENKASVELSGDYDYLKELCGGLAHVEVELLANAEAGTVIVDNGEEITDAGIQTQLRMIRELGDGHFRGDAAEKKRSPRRKTAEPDDEGDEG